MTRKLLISVLLTLAATGLVRADTDPVLERLESLVGPDASPIVSSTPIDGLVQVMLGSEVFFMTSDGKFYIKGQVVNMDSRDDLTELALRGFRQKLIQAIDMDTLISYGPNGADHDLIVFTDTDCGYCRKLHELIDDYNALGIRIHYAAYPRAGIGSSTYSDLVSVWCSDQPRKAMDRAQAGQSNPRRQCDTPIDSHIELARQVRVGGTPTLLMSNGELIAGLPQPEELRTRLDRALVQSD